MTEPNTGDDHQIVDDVTKLAMLIDQFYAHIKENIGDFAKVGDLLKMIELKNKLLPDNSNQKEFWKMMEQIRRRKLPPGEKQPHASDLKPKRSRVA
jgi:hypothetical protein